MKTIKMIKLLIPVTLLVFILASCSSSQNAVGSEAPSGSVTYQSFYNALSPYGSWMDYPGYGEVWHPYMGAGFRPYDTDGHWVYTGLGWAWASDFSWGWAPFHYGRWLYDDFYGWVWVPGYEWSPAWVQWGFVDDFYCWAPLMPGIEVGVGFRSWMPHSIYWNYVPRRYITNRHVSTFIVRNRETINTTYNRISVINNFNQTKVHNNYYAAGPRVDEVEKYTEQHITPAQIRTFNKPGATEVINSKNEMRIYRPEVQAPKENEMHRPMPSEMKEVNRQEMRPVREMNEHIVGPRQEQFENFRSMPSFPASHFRAPAPERPKR